MTAKETRYLIGLANRMAMRVYVRTSVDDWRQIVLQIIFFNLFMNFELSAGVGVILMSEDFADDEQNDRSFGHLSRAEGPG